MVWRRSTAWSLAAIVGIYLCGYAAAESKWLACLIEGAVGVYALLRSYDE